MKLALSILLASSSAQCSDESLGDLCFESCADTKEGCVYKCDDADYTCETRCLAIETECRIACPCSSGCPSGCFGCSSEFCGNGNLLIMDDNWKERRVGYNLNMATNSIQVATVNYEHPVDFSMEDTCTVVFHGKTHFFGGFRNPRRFATLQNCRVVPNSYGLRYPHIDGIYGSCAVHANAVFMCFGNESAPLANRCQMWREGQEGMDEPTTANEHDWAAMVSFNKKLLVVGGCSKNGPGCNGAVETYQAGDYDGWTSLTAHPATAGIFGHGLTTDGESVFLFGGMTKSLGADSYNQSVWRFRNNTWSEIGTLQQVASGAVVSTAFQMGRFAISGEIYLEKFNLVGDNVQSTRINAPDIDDMEMYYSSFLYTDDPICL